ncbi:hypothetical protein AB0D47_36795, partial [Streptomyces sp. NPDC048376]|uniref:hypothetical protein n=1 Tax=Streptomyces sp. NPDC048376 TaxID=3154926 RepID=UPI0034491002
KPLRDRLLGVLGASEARADHLARHAGDWQALADRFRPSYGAGHGPHGLLGRRGGAPVGPTGRP